MYISIYCFASLLCLIPGYFADHLMAGPWQYHLFNLPPAPPPPNAVQLLFPSYSTCSLFIPCRLLERTQWGSADLRVHDNTWAIWSVCYSALLWRLEARRIKASAAGNSWDAQKYNYSQPLKKKCPSYLAKTVCSCCLLEEVLDAACALVYGMEVLRFQIKRQKYTSS